MYNLIQRLYFSTSTTSITPKQLYKHLLKESKKLPKGIKDHYIHAVKQSFKQHVHESDPERVNQMIEKSLEDAKWVLNKYLNKK